VSADNGSNKYNEPKDVRDEFLRMGTPDSAIFLDYAGFRTFDSMLRAQKIFGQSTFIVVSQQFHNKRAVYIARDFGIEAFGYNSEDLNAYMGIKTRLREFFVRAKVFVDFLFDRKPKFLGEKIRIN
jgi:SanA protein